MLRFELTTTDAAFAEAWGGATIVAEGDVHGLRVAAAPDRTLIGTPIDGITADGQPIAEQLAAMYIATVKLLPID